MDLGFPLKLEKHAKEEETDTGFVINRQNF